MFGCRMPISLSEILKFDVFIRIKIRKFNHDKLGKL